MNHSDFPLARIEARWISKFRSELRRTGREETTIDSHCRHLKAMLRWSTEQGMVNRVPKFVFSKKSTGQKLMKGRPIKSGEFEWMLAKVSLVVCAPDSRRKTQAIFRCFRQSDVAKRVSLLTTIEELNGRIELVSKSWR